MSFIKRFPTRIILFIGFVVLILFLSPALFNLKQPTANNNTALSLQAPLFLVAQAEANEFGTILDEQAGIAAYFNANKTINFSTIRGEFRTIEIETADYMVGSMPITGYDEAEDAHVYVHTSGWVLAYYLNQDPTAKIFDWRSGPESNKLEMALSIIASKIGVPTPNPADFYDFRYPNATNLMLVSDSVYFSAWGTTHTDNFDINLPSDLAYYELSWSLVSDTTCGSYNGFGRFYIDEMQIKNQGCDRWRISDGILSITQLLPDQFHTVKLQAGSYGAGYGASIGLAIVYEEQP